jgi:hypothetical protein
VLLRRNIAIDAETAQLVADAVQAVLRAGPPSRPPRRGPRVPAADCEPLFLSGAGYRPACLQLPDNRAPGSTGAAAFAQVACCHGRRCCPRTPVIAQQDIPVFPTFATYQENESGAGWSGSAPLAAATSVSSASMICVLALVTWGGVQV